MGVAETALRKLLLTQVGISVSELTLVGSHILRAGSEQHPVSRLNLIFGTEYCSGILNPQPDLLKSALWIPQVQLEGQVPEWLRAAIQELNTMNAAEHVATVGTLGGLFGRRKKG